MSALVLTVVNFCSWDKVGSHYLPVIEDAVTVYRTLFGDDVLDIRLMGSVARDEANRDSDIDFIAVSGTPPSTDQERQLAREEHRLCDKYSFIARVDLEAVAIADLSEFRRFVFATDSLSVFGVDAYSARTVNIERRKLAEMVTPDLTAIGESYQYAVETTGESDEQLLCFYSRLIGKDFLKCFRRLALMRGGEYERNIGGIYRQCLQYVPEYRELLHELFELYSNPTGDKQRLVQALRRAETIGISGLLSDNS